MAALTRKATDRAMTVSIVLKRIARVTAASSAVQLPRLHQGRMQIEIVRHHRRADDADGHDDHPLLAEPGRQPGRGPFPGNRACVCGRTKISMK